VFDSVGGVLFERSLRSAANRGRLVEIALTGQRRVDFDLIDFYHNETRILGADTRKLDAVESGKILAALVPGFESVSTSRRRLPRPTRSRRPSRRTVPSNAAFAVGSSSRCNRHPLRDAEALRRPLIYRRVRE
jgi:NADPH2:quinone reductase